MFLRLLFLLLLVLNLGVAAWLAFGGTAHVAVPAADPGVAELRLLSEASSVGAADPAQARHESRPARSGDRCLSVGPFDTQAQTRDAVDALTPHVARIQFHQEQATQSRGWWVYLPAMKTHEQALSAARALSAKGVHDYYVVTAGDQQNTVSLGLFNDRANAQRRLDQLVALGFKPSMNERLDSMPVYRVDFTIPSAPGFDWHAYVATAGVEARQIPCF